MTVGRDPATIDQDEPDEDTVAAALGFDDLDSDDTDSADAEDVDEPLSNAELTQLVLDQQETIAELREEKSELRERVDELEDTQERSAKDRAEIRQDVTDLDERVERASDVASNASALATQAQDAIDDDADTRSQSLPGGVEPSSSPLDFFANNYATTVRQYFLDQNKKNAFRAVQAAKKWDEYATRRSDGSGVFFTRDDLEMALVDVLGEKPHPQTVSRVWEKLRDLGGDDLQQKTRRVSAKQEPMEILVMDSETAEGLFDGRYQGLDLLDGAGPDATAGGVTPVVTAAGGTDP